MTLVEVMAAMGILTVGILAVASTIVASLLSLRVSRDRQDATQVASSTLETIRAMDWGAIAHTGSDPTAPSGTHPVSGEPYIVATSGQVTGQQTVGKFTVTNEVTWKQVSLERRVVTVVSWSDKGTERTVVEETVIAEARRGLPAPAFEIDPATQAVLKPESSLYECAEHDLINLGEQDKYDATMTNGSFLIRSDLDVDGDGLTDTVEGFQSQGWFGWVQIDTERMKEQTGDLRPDSISFTGRNEVSFLELCYTPHGTPASAPTFDWQFRSAFDPDVDATVTHTLTVVTGNTILYLHHPLRNNGQFDTNANSPYFMSTTAPTATDVTTNFDKTNVDALPGRRVVAGSSIAWDYQFTEQRLLGDTLRLVLYVNTNGGLNGTDLTQSFPYSVRASKVNTSAGTTVTHLVTSATTTHSQTTLAWTRLTVDLDASALTAAQRTMGVNEYLRIEFLCGSGGVNCHVHYDITGANAKDSQLQLVLS